MHDPFKDMKKFINKNRDIRIYNNISTAVIHAETKHPIFPDDIKHQALILAEESGEVMQAVLNHTDHGKDYDLIEDELYQTIAVCIRMLKENK